MNALEALIRRRIAAEGPMGLPEYMALCLGHPRHGYYATREPLGADFTTAPEISQMFGEIIGLWLAQAWRGIGAPAPFVLVELGPGRGVLMADALRAAATVAPEFAEGARLWLVETSPTMRRAQAAALSRWSPRWADRLEEAPALPLLLVANEFLDALPARQAEFRGGVWRERVIGLGEEGLVFGLGGALPGEGGGREGDLREWSPAAEAVASAVGARLAETGGAALLIDYGEAGPQGETLQAIRAGGRAHPLEAPGEADLTTHVDFAAIAARLREAGAAPHGPTPQGVFLERLGITERANALAASARDEAAFEAIAAAHRRLTHPDEMGALFKTLAATGPTHPAPPPGFA